MPPDHRRRALRLAPPPEPDPFTLEGDDDSGSDAGQGPPAVGRLGAVTLQDWARECWPMHLYAVIGNEVGKAVDAGILTLPEGEFLVARITTVIDQAIGDDDR
jgi:hypothetical protein